MKSNRSKVGRRPKALSDNNNKGVYGHQSKAAFAKFFTPVAKKRKRGRPKKSEIAAAAAKKKQQQEALAAKALAEDAEVYYAYNTHRRPNAEVCSPGPVP